jgi:hypothetical protein
MRETVLRVPVACPKCTQERLMDLPAQTVAAALKSGAPLLLFASCHQLAWKANPIEREQLHEYLEAATLPPPTMTPHEAVFPNLGIVAGVKDPTPDRRGS